MVKQLVLYSAALLGSTFVVATAVHAEAPVVQSKPDHVRGQNPTSTPSTSGPDTAFIENLMFQVQDLQQQVADQRGLIEELTYQVQVLKQEQKERYIDLDQRILTLQEQLSSASQNPVSQSQSASNAVDASAVSNEDILAEYNAARELIRARKFPEAIQALNNFTQAHPDHSLTPNAWYWLGEVHQVSRQVAEARTAFSQVVDRFPNHSKVPDSLYKLGVIAQQQGNANDAKRYFEQVISKYPDSQSAKLAQARLNSN